MGNKGKDVIRIDKLAQLINPHTRVAFFGHRAIKRRLRLMNLHIGEDVRAYHPFMSLALKLHVIVVYVVLQKVCTDGSCCVKYAFFQSCFCDLDGGIRYLLVHEEANVFFLKPIELPHMYHSYSMFLRISLPIALDINGGTALPTSVY